MGDTGTDHRKPANIRQLKKSAGELPAYVTTDDQHVIVMLGGNGNWMVFQRTPGVFMTRRAAAEHVDNPDRAIA
jgi:hypothetical protein